ncbi:hypothetical protein ACVIJW_007583 [Bradyrhizobium barranii subsp. barranii]
MQCAGFSLGSADRNCRNEAASTSMSGRDKAENDAFESEPHHVSEMG